MAKPAAAPPNVDLAENLLKNKKTNYVGKLDTDAAVPMTSVFYSADNPHHKKQTLKVSAPVTMAYCMMFCQTVRSSFS